MTAPHARAVVLHAVSAEEWAAADDPFRPESLTAEGFIHLSTPEQMAWVANQRFAGRDDMVLLVVDVDRLPLPLVWEDCYEAGQDFPHLYAALPHSAITATVPYPPAADGHFRPPTLPSS